MNQGIVWAFMGTGFTFLMTAFGASVVFILKNDMGKNLQRAFLGFAAGVMIAASVWSLLIPSIDQAADMGNFAFVPAAGGFMLGGIFLMLLDMLMPHLHLGENKAEGVPSSFRRTTLLILAVTLHNIPEGMAVGLAFALSAQHPEDASLYAAAFALAVGIGIQNFPEGAAISLPLRQEGMSKGKACGTDLWCRDHDDRRGDHTIHAMVSGICGGCHDLRGRGRTDPGGQSGRTFQSGDRWCHGWISHHDGAGCSTVITKI